MKKTPWAGVRDVDVNAGLLNRKQIRVPTLEAIVLHLPIPPSVNALFYNRARGTRGPGRGKTPHYIAWIAEATFDLKLQNPGRIDGRYTIDILVPRESNADVWNLEKAISDLLQKQNVITNDKLSEGGSIYWCDEAKAINVTVRPYPKPE